MVIPALEVMVQNDRDLMGEVLLYPRPVQILQILTLDLSLINWTIRDIAIILIIFLPTMFMYTMFIYNLPICVQQFLVNTRNLIINKQDISTESKKYLGFVQISFISLHVCTVHQQYQSTFYYSTMMHTIIKSKNIKTIKIPKVAPTCFGSHRNNLQGASFWPRHKRRG
jgi:hypothetical protein